MSQSKTRFGRDLGRGLPYGFAEVAIASLLMAVAYGFAYGGAIEPLVRSSQVASASPAPQMPATERAALEAGDNDPSSKLPAYTVPTGTAHKLYVRGSRSFSSSEECASLASAITAFESKGYELGFCVRDLRSGTTIAYNSNAGFYTASSIKGPYVTSVFQELVDGGRLSLDDALAYAEPIIVDSDNDAYVGLSNALGRGCFDEWLHKARVGSGVYATLDDYASPHYPVSTPWQLAQEWHAIYDYIGSGAGSSATLGDLFQRRGVSPIRDALGEKHKTWSKAGWYPDDEGDAHPATNDAGVVLSDDGPYVVAVMSTAPEDFESVADVVAAVDQALPAAMGD